MNHIRRLAIQHCHTSSILQLTMYHALQAIRTDTCVPDGDANISVYEDYAQINVAWIYQHATGELHCVQWTQSSISTLHRQCQCQPS